ncbi:gamma-glutamylcyclotransferase family protein [Shimia isoporae]|nr:gamma-glutamylcyclotransferase family protein [Shimia isoporae]
MSTPYFFGYGSLVNTRTHDYADAQPAQLLGWKRAWVATDLRPFAFLSAEPELNSVIDGLIAHVPGNDWAALDQREFAYDRMDASADVTHAKSDPIRIAVYSVSNERRVRAETPPRILLSYLDVVVQGYLRVFGRQGVADFFATTDGWSAEVLDDRAAPIYPRHQRLSDEETSLVDHHLAALEATRVQPS